MSIYSDMYLSWLHISKVMADNYNAGGWFWSGQLPN